MIDLHSRWPSIKRRSNAPTVAPDPARSTVLDSPLGKETARRADPARVRDLLSQLVTEIGSRPLSDWIPLAETIPLLIGLTPGNLASFDEFLGAFIGTVLENGRTVEPGSVTSPSDSISANRRRQLGASALGVKRAANVEPGRPASARKFDELMMLFSEARTLAAILADADDGLPPGTSEIIGAMLTAIKNNLVSGDSAAARQAGADAGALIAAVHATFFGGEGAERTPRMRKVGENHYALDGYETVRKGRAHVIGVDVDGEVVATKDVKVADGKFVRKRKRKV